MISSGASPQRCTLLLSVRHSATYPSTSLSETPERSTRNGLFLTNSAASRLGDLASIIFSFQLLGVSNQQRRNLRQRGCTDRGTECLVSSASASRHGCLPKIATAGLHSMAVPPPRIS